MRLVAQRFGGQVVKAEYELRFVFHLLYFALNYNYLNAAETLFVAWMSKIVQIVQPPIIYHLT